VTLILYDGQDVLFAKNEILFVALVNLSSSILGVNDGVPNLNLKGNAIAILVEPPRTDSLDQALLGLFLYGIGQNDPATGGLVLSDRLDHHSIT
jgi:hypothetical protein